MKGGIFLDRDGTIIEDKNYLSNPDEVVLLPGVQKAIKRFILMGYRIFLFSNQSGVGRGMFTLDDVEACNRRMIDLLGFGDYIFSGKCLATEAPDSNIVYRKPSPKFILEMIEKHGLLKQDCFMVGDSTCDIRAGINAGITPVLLSKCGDCISDEMQHMIDQQIVLNYYDLESFSRLLI